MDWKDAVMAILVIAAIFLAKPLTAFLDKVLHVSPGTLPILKPWRYHVLLIASVFSMALFLQLLVLLIGRSPAVDYWVAPFVSLFLGALCIAGWSLVYGIFLRKFHLK